MMTAHEPKDVLQPGSPDAATYQAAVNGVKVMDETAINAKKNTEYPVFTGHCNLTLSDSHITDPNADCKITTSGNGLDFKFESKNIRGKVFVVVDAPPRSWYDTMGTLVGNQPAFVTYREKGWKWWSTASMKVYIRENNRCFKPLTENIPGTSSEVCADLSPIELQQFKEKREKQIAAQDAERERQYARAHDYDYSWADSSVGRQFNLGVMIIGANSIRDVAGSSCQEGQKELGDMERMIDEAAQRQDDASNGQNGIGVAAGYLQGCKLEVENYCRVGGVGRDMCSAFMRNEASIEATAISHYPRLKQMY